MEPPTSTPTPTPCEQRNILRPKLPRRWFFEDMAKHYDVQSCVEDEPQLGATPEGLELQFGLEQEGRGADLGTEGGEDSHLGSEVHGRQVSAEEAGGQTGVRGE